ncbi:MAG: peptidoglycan DL-endopeptidase CwlO [Actinomycetota bacterium]|jgi:cell wall-associated NlpC family hydrolase|nr:peptidoglycan DL-endopeptidase CwlO [Actinomycetota bacterium]
MAQTVRRCLPRPAAGRRARGLAVAAVVLTLVASLAPGASADNRDPVFPSQAEVDASKGTVAQKADQVGQIEAQLAAASVRADRLATDVARAVEAYNGARFRLQQAIQEALAAQQAAEAARAQVETARTELGRFAAAAYRSGGDLGGLSTFLVASGPRDLISRAAALQSIGDSRRHALENLRSAQAYATVLDRRAATMLDKRQEAAQRVERAKATAEARLETQRQAVGQIDAQRQTLVRALATARHTSVRLEQARQAGLAQARAEAARLAAERAAAAAARKAAAEAAAQAAEDARRSQAEKAQRDQEQRDADAKKAADQPASDPSPGNGGGGGGGGGGGASEPSAPNPPPSGSSSGSASGAEAAIDFAMAQMGKPYEWGADGPSTYDCSGLVMRAWQQGGVSLPHYSVEQYARSQPVALSDLRRGDLVFFASGSDYQSIYHVGLYIGSGQMIEAPYTGENVRISSIWRSSLFGAARP